MLSIFERSRMTSDGAAVDFELCSILRASRFLMSTPRRWSASARLMRHFCSVLQMRECSSSSLERTVSSQMRQTTWTSGMEGTASVGLFGDDSFRRPESLRVSSVMRGRDTVVEAVDERVDGEILAPSVVAVVPDEAEDDRWERDSSGITASIDGSDAFSEPENSLPVDFVRVWKMDEKNDLRF